MLVNKKRIVLLAETYQKKVTPQFIMAVDRKVDELVRIACTKEANRNVKKLETL